MKQRPMTGNCAKKVGQKMQHNFFETHRLGEAVKKKTLQKPSRRKAATGAKTGLSKRVLPTKGAFFRRLRRASVIHHFIIFFSPCRTKQRRCLVGVCNGEVVEEAGVLLLFLVQQGPLWINVSRRFRWPVKDLESPDKTSLWRGDPLPKKRVAF